MNAWTKVHIGIVFFSGLTIALIVSILIVLYLRPVRATIKKITGNLDSIWNGTFKTTVILGGLLGAMSVTFYDCEGNYDYLYESKDKTILKGIEQVTTSIDWLMIILGIWLIIFIFMQLIKKNKDSLVHNKG